MSSRRLASSSPVSAGMPGPTAPAHAGRAAVPQRSALRVWVEASRGDVVESRHEVFCVSARASAEAQREGEGAAAPHPLGAPTELGSAGVLTFMRSAAKPLQLLAIVASGGAEHWGLDQRDLAVMAASHQGTFEHATRVHAILQRLGLGPEALLCGVHRPYFLNDLPAESPERLHLFGPLHNNCSGNHAAMLALALEHGVAPERYLDPKGEGQARAHAVVEALCGVPPRLAVDDCGSPCYGMPLGAMAEAYLFLARPAAVHGLSGARRTLLESVAPLERIESALERIARAMAEHPECVSGWHTGATRLARLRPGAIVIKHGAEGVVCAANRERDEAFALKVGDGNPRAVLPALVFLLRRSGWIDAEPDAALLDLAEPELRGHAGNTVGKLRVARAEPLGVE